MFHGGAAGRMQRDQPGLSELRLTDLEYAFCEIDIGAIQIQAFADAQTGDCQQAK